MKSIKKKILDEKVEYKGIINFASRGIKGDSEMMIKAFYMGFEIGVECTKEDVIDILNKRGIKK